MKIKITEGTRHGKPVMRCVAKIIKSQTLQIPKTMQRTWSTPFDSNRSQYTKEQVADMFKSAARKWQLQKYKVLFGDTLPEAIQAELV